MSRCLIFVLLAALATLYPSNVASADGPGGFYGALPNATPIALHLKEQSPKDAFQQLGTLAKVTFVAKAGWPDAKPITLDANGQPYWDVVAALCKKSGMKVARYWHGEVYLEADEEGEWSRRQSVVHGPFRIDVGQIQVRKTAVLSSKPEKWQMYTLTLNLQAEPAIYFVACEHEKLDKLLDESGNALPHERMPGVLPNMKAYHNLAILDVVFTPEKSPKKISVISGTIPLYVQDTSEMLEVADVLDAHGKTGRAAGLAFAVTTEKQDLGFDVEVKMSGGGPQGLARIANLRNRSLFDGPRLIDDKGRDYTAVGCMTEKTSIKVQFRSVKDFQRLELGPPAKLLWSIPSGWHSVEVPFEFKDIVLP